MLANTLALHTHTERGKTVKLSEKSSISKEIHLYLLCLALKRLVTILKKKPVLNPRLTLCVSKTLLNRLVFKYELAVIH